MIPGLAMMIAAYTVARLLVLPAQVNGTGRIAYAIVIAALGIGGVAFGLVQVYMATASGGTPLP